MSTKEKVIVTGGAGFIGSHLSDALILKGYDVHIIDDLSTGFKEDIPKDATFHEMSIVDTEKILPIFKGAKAVFHLAALARVPFSFDHPRESHTANIDGTFSVLMAARDANVGRVIYSGSSSSYGPQEKLPFTEDMRPNPISLYSLQKLVGEQYAQLFSENYGLPTVSLRFFNVYGKRMRPEGGYALALPKFIKLRKEGKPLPITGDGTQTRDFTHISDTVQACILAMESTNVGKGEMLNISAGRNVSMNVLADIIGGEREYIGARPADLKDTYGDNSKAKKLLGWTPTTKLEDGVKELLREADIV